jgi:hypothetical protein
VAKEEQVDVIGTLSEALGEQLEKQRKKAQPIPEVYSSGMRGKEKPPHLREQKRPAKKQNADEGEERYTEDGKRVVTFKAKPKVKVGDEIAALKKQVADLTKRVGEPRDKPQGHAADKKNPAIQIA